MVAAYAGAALVAGVILLLSTVWAARVAALVVGGVCLLVAGVFVLVGRGQIKAATPPVPKHAVEGVKRDVEAVKEGTTRR